MISATGGLFDLVLGLCRRRRLPLHVAGRVGAAAIQWLDVIHNETRALPLGLAGRRAIRPLAVRAQVMPLVAAALEPVTAERRSDRAADGGALRGAERGLLLLVEAHAGSAASRRQSAMTKFRIIMKIQSVACVGGKWGGEQSVAPGSFCVFAEARNSLAGW